MRVFIDLYKQIFNLLTEDFLSFILPTKEFNVELSIMFSLTQKF